jgi:hypothetical protein
LRHRDVGLELVVALDELDLAAAELAAALLQRQREAVVDVGTDRRGRRREAGDEADLELVGGPSGRRPEQQSKHQGDRRENPDHSLPFPHRLAVGALLHVW